MNTIMHELPRQKLCELINRHGTILCEDAKRCESFLRDACTNQYNREIFVLINAIKEGIVKDLLHPPRGLPNEALFTRLIQRLHNNLALDTIAAEWAVYSWGIALGVKLPTPTIKKKSKTQLFNPSLKNLQLPTIKLTEQLQQIVNPANIPVQPITSSLEPLSPLKPVDYFRLLWWILMMPQQLYAYRQIFGLEDEQRVGKWLASFLLWGPLFLLTFTLGLGYFNHSGPVFPTIYLALSVLIMVSGLLTAGLEIKQNQGVVFIIAFLIAFGVAFAVALGLLDAILLSVTTVIAIVVGAGVAECVVGRLSYMIALGVVIGMTVGIVGSIAGNEAGGIAAGEAFIATIVVLGFTSERIENSLKNGQPSLLARIAFLVLVVTYLMLLVFYLIQVFG
jgi:hypothetical protein